MASRFERCLAALVARGAVGKDHAQEVLDGFRSHKARGLDDAAAALQASRFDLWKKQQARAQMAEQIMKWRNDIIPRAEAHPKGFAVGARAVLMADKYGKAGAPAAQNIIGAYRGVLHSLFVTGLDAFRSKMGGLVKDVPGLVRWLRELYAENTGDATANAASRAWTDMADFAAGEFIAKGGALARRTDWRLPNPPLTARPEQAEELSKYLHDAHSRGDLRLIDFETGQPADPFKAAEIIADAVETITTDGLNKLVPGQIRGTKIANSRTARRVLHWTNADAWLDANRRWGVGDSGIWNVITGHIDSMARDIGLMHALGPNPAGMAKMLGDEVKRRGGSSWDVSVIQGAYDHLSGNIATPVHEALAYAQRQLGALHTSADLLSSPLSAIGDMATLALTSLWNGLPVTKMIVQYLRAFGPGGHLTRRDAVRGALEADFWINRAHAAVKDGEAFGGSSWLERSTDFLYRASAANVQAMNARAVFQLGFLGEIADQAGRGFDQLKGRTKRAFARVGIMAGDWERIRKAAVDMGGAAYAYPEALMKGERADIDAGIKLLSLINREQDFAQVMGDLRAQMVRTLGTKAGTAVGFATREFMRFKSYSIGVLVTHLNRMLFETENWQGRLGYGLGLFVMTTVLGGLAIQLRMIRDGKDPRDMQTPSFWAAAVFQGGGLGIFGDFIKSGVSRTGGSFWSAVAGPTAGLIEDASDIMLGNIGQAAEGKNTNWGREAVRFLRNHTPGASLWFARRAIDGYLFDYLQTQLDPNYAEGFRRLEMRARREIGTQYWWRPGAFGPERAPDLGAAWGGR